MRRKSNRRGSASQSAAAPHPAFPPRPGEPGSRAIEYVVALAPHAPPADHAALVAAMRFMEEAASGPMRLERLMARGPGFFLTWWSLSRLIVEVSTFWSANRALGRPPSSPPGLLRLVDHCVAECRRQVTEMTNG